MGQTGDDGINTGHNNVTVAAGEIIGLQSNYGCSTSTTAVIHIVP
ncbi:hypothetical protein [Xenorhabdus bovienii]|nr:hypothetical protein [Xenorhabdus bovienii]